MMPPPPQPLPPLTTTASSTTRRRRRQATVNSFFTNVSTTCVTTTNITNNNNLSVSSSIVTNVMSNEVDIAPRSTSVTWSIINPFHSLSIPPIPKQRPTSDTTPKSSSKNTTTPVVDTPVTAVTDLSGVEAPSSDDDQKEKHSESGKVTQKVNENIQTVEEEDDEKIETHKRTRKRRRPSSITPRRSRPRTRASLRCERSPSPPSVSSSSSSSSEEEEDDDNDDDGGDNDDDYEQQRNQKKDRKGSPVPVTPPSRLNKARNAARRALRSHTTQLQLQSKLEIQKTDTKVQTQSESQPQLQSSQKQQQTEKDPIVIIEVDDNNTPPVKKSDSDNHKKVTSKPTKLDNIEKKSNSSLTVTKPKQKLHPFFAATAAAMNMARDRAKIPRLERPVCDAWTYNGATIHVNYQSSSLTSNSIPFSFPSTTKFNNDVSSFLSENYSFYPSSSCKNVKKKKDDSKKATIKAVSSNHFDTWAEHYRSDSRIDVINAPATDELTEWLCPWYVNINDGEDVEDEEDDVLAELDDGDSEEKERIAIITGPVGSVKSTIVSTAARRLGLSILEINAGVCRTGRRVRDIIGEALKSHRVMSSSSSGYISTSSITGACNTNTTVNNNNNNNNLFTTNDVFDETTKIGKKRQRLKTARTLIVFEEVDELQADEKGFWTSVLELASSTDCKRPIVCIANTFTVSMRQFFIEKKKGARYDFDRLFLSTREEHIANDMPFKHISLPYTRSHRQVLSIMQRIAHTEKTSKSLHETLSMLHRRDTRRAVNALQFWTANGLISSSSSSSCLDGLLHGSIECDVARAKFAVGSSCFARCVTLSASSVDKNNKNMKTLEHWADTLETLSLSDSLWYTRQTQIISRNAENRLSPDAICLDADLQACENIQNDLQAHAVHYSRQYLAMPQQHQQDDNDDDSNNNNIVEHGDLRAIQAPFVHALPTLCCKGRGHVLAEYIPTLVSMVRAESRSGGGGSCSSAGVGVDGIGGRRRTRSRSKLSGLSALDLDNATVLVLKKCSIADGCEHVEDGGL